MLSVTVRNRDGQNLTGLSREAFELTDEKEVRAIEFFENTDSPLSIGILVDTSPSVQFFEVSETARATAIGEVISRFLQLGNTDNEYFVLAFGQVPRLLTDWTTGTSLLAQKTDVVVEAKGNTALYDTCSAALDKLSTAHRSRRALILVSDGLDNASRLTFVKLRQRFRESDLTLYGIGIPAPSDFGPSSLGLEGQGVLTELAEVTGGKAFFAKSKKQLNSAIEQVAHELRDKYRIGFRPDKTAAPNKWHRLRLKVELPPNVPAEFNKVVVRTRPGYYTH